MSRKKFAEEIFVGERGFHVTGNYYLGWKGNWDNPPEPAEIEFIAVEQTEGDPWQEDEMFIDDASPDIWLFVEKYEDEFYEKALSSIEDDDYDGE
jgi:hypothetical protein